MKCLYWNIKFIFLLFSECLCSSNGSVGTDCNKSGDCTCKTNFVGSKCDDCTTGYFKQNGLCKSCNCNRVGSYSKDCNPYGHCNCRSGFKGKRCDDCATGYAGTQCNRCSSGYFGYPNCQSKFNVFSLHPKSLLNDTI